MKVGKALSIADLAVAARRRLPPGIFGYVHGGSEDHQSLDGNRAAYRRWRFLTRPLTDVSKRSQQVTVFGKSWASPFGIAPMGACCLAAVDGDVAMARVAGKAGVPFVLSAASTVPLERVMQEAPGSWYQAYLPADRVTISGLLERLKRAEVEVLVVTVDVQVASVRENELRNGFTMPLRVTPGLVLGGLMRPGWLLGTFARTMLTQGIPHFENFTDTRGGTIVTVAKGDHRAGRAAMTWEHIRFMREHWPGKLCVKGILRPEDAVKAREAGCDAIFVSNHGGRQLDGAIPPLDALPAIVAAVPGMTVFLDGGIRRGTDALKALALGATMAFVGRPALYGLAAGGEAGAAHALAILRREIDIDQALLGCPDVAALDPSWLDREPR